MGLYVRLLLVTLPSALLDEHTASSSGSFSLSVDIEAWSTTAIIEEAP
jgi:hypothetical protein